MSELKNQTISEIRRLRVEIDKCMKLTGAGSPEVTLCRRSLQRAYAWLGTSLGYLGSPHPYPNDKELGSDKVDARKDVFEDEPFLTGVGHIQKAKQLREEIKECIITPLENLVPDLMLDQSEEFDYRFITASHNAMDALTEARHWLGWEMERYSKANEYPATMREAIRPHDGAGC